MKQIPVNAVFYPVCLYDNIQFEHRRCLLLNLLLE